jgi:predicted nucleic-acid-binding Zn-ribbon protein
MAAGGGRASVLRDLAGLVGCEAMRTTHVCPKCSHGEVLFVPHLADRDDDDSVRPLSLHVKHLDWKDVEMGQLQAYVCRGCGYTELYTVGAAALPVDRIPGAEILRAKT